MTKLAPIKVFFPLFDPIDPLILKPGGAPKWITQRFSFVPIHPTRKKSPPEIREAYP